MTGYKEKEIKDNNDILFMKNQGLLLKLSTIQSQMLVTKKEKKIYVLTWDTCEIKKKKKKKFTKNIV